MIKKKTGGFAMNEVFCSPTTAFYGPQKPVRALGAFKPAGASKVEVMFIGDEDGCLLGVGVNEIDEIKHKKEDLQKLINDMEYYEQQISNNIVDFPIKANQHTKWWSGIKEENGSFKEGLGGWVYPKKDRWHWFKHSSPKGEKEEMLDAANSDADLIMTKEELDGLRQISNLTKTQQELKIWEDIWTERSGPLCYKSKGGKKFDGEFEDADYCILPVQGFGAYIGAQGAPVMDISVNEVGHVDEHGVFHEGEFVISASGSCIYEHNLKTARKMRQPKSWKASS